MTAAHPLFDRTWLQSLTGAELLLLRLRYGKSVSAAVETELNRRAGAEYGNVEYVPVAKPSVRTVRRRIRRSTAA